MLEYFASRLPITLIICQVFDVLLSVYGRERDLMTNIGFLNSAADLLTYEYLRFIVLSPDYSLHTVTLTLNPLTSTFLS